MKRYSFQGQLHEITLPKIEKFQKKVKTLSKPLPYPSKSASINASRRASIFLSKIVFVNSVTLDEITIMYEFGMKRYSFLGQLHEITLPKIEKFQNATTNS